MSMLCRRPLLKRPRSTWIPTEPAPILGKRSNGADSGLWPGRLSHAYAFYGLRKGDFRAMKDEEAIGAGKLFIDPYLNWIKREGVPIHEGFGINLHKVDVKPWARTGVKGAAVHVAGRGDFMTLFVIE